MASGIASAGQRCCWRTRVGRWYQRRCRRYRGQQPVKISHDAPELGTGAVGGVEVDVGAVSDGGIREI